MKKAGVTPLFFVRFESVISYTQTTQNYSFRIAMPFFARSFFPFLLRLTLVVGSAISSLTVSAQQAAPELSAILVSGPLGALVRVADVLSELRRAPAAERKSILSKPEMVQQIANNVLVRRVLAEQAIQDGLTTDPVIGATLAIAKDRVLSDERLARLDEKNTPTAVALDAYARDIYKSNAARFEKPAQTRARHILLAKDGPQAMEKAKNILAQLRAGASFEELAKANSIDPGSAVRGGDLGFFGAGRMVQPFEEALDKLLEPGALSGVVESEFGYHIIRLEGRREKSVQPYADVREQLLGEARTAILNSSRVQIVRDMSKDFIFDREAIEALTKSTVQ